MRLLSNLPHVAKNMTTGAILLVNESNVMFINNEAKNIIGFNSKNDKKILDALYQKIKNNFLHHMQVPIRKPGQYSRTSPDFNITQEKFNELKKTLYKLQNVNFPRARDEVSRLALMGDFSENAAYQIAKGKLRSINQKILDLQNFLKKAVIIRPNPKTNVVSLGHKVTLEGNGKTATYQILGATETAPSHGIISCHSPIGAALIGKQVGDLITINVQNKKLKYKIVKIT